MANGRICYLAQSESPKNSDCPNCSGTTLLTLDAVAGAVTGKVYWAPHEYEGRGLWTYAVDGKPGLFITGPLLDKVVEVEGEKVYPVPVGDKGFSELCLFYDKEGGARINVAAAVDGAILRPEGGGKADGTDPNCPIESATLAGKAYPPGNFEWSDDVVTKWNVSADLDGGWTTTPPAGKGQMKLRAKPLLPTDQFFAACRFRHWEFNLLTPTKEGPRIEEDESIEFGQNIFAGLIAHYELVHVDPDIREPILKPGEISIGDPGPRLFLAVRQHRVAYDIGRLAEGSIRPIRNDPGRAGHGSVLREPRIGRDLRARIARAARAAADAQDELRELLLRLPPPAG